MTDTTESIAISRFKATCLAVLERVRVTGQPVLITRFGEPVAEVIPPSPPRPAATWLGTLRGRGSIAGDITLPALPEWSGSE
jgi:prevent-host-death family protein